MTQEQMYLKFVQIVVSLNTILFVYGIMQAKKGNIELHKKINGFAAATTLVGVVGLVVTLFLGFDYSTITSPTRMLIHRSFSVPLLPLLIAVIWSGATNRKALHKKFAYIMTPFWLGTLVTGWWFFY